MRILISGSSGLIGKKLIRHFEEKGDSVTRLLRRSSIDKSGNAIFGDPITHSYNRSEFEGFDLMINLAGKNISSGRWTEAKKEEILDSRISCTRMLAGCITQLQQPPKLLINASAMGYYGDHGVEEVTELTPKGKGFLAKVCEEWEAAAAPAIQCGVRTVFLRLGIVLSPDGGALKKILAPFKLGLGGRLGSGEQYMSWISIEDVIQIVQYVIDNENMAGPVNLSTPNPVTNAEFTSTLGKVLGAPTFMTVPAPVLRFLLGEMGEDLLLSSIKMIPKKLQEAGYQFQYPTLQEALIAMLKSS